MRPGAPLSPGLVSKTRDPQMWLTSVARVSARLLSGPGPGRYPGQGGWQSACAMSWYMTWPSWE
jgi:hypothetical protein